MGVEGRGADPDDRVNHHLREGHSDEDIDPRATHLRSGHPLAQSLGPLTGRFHLVNLRRRLPEEEIRRDGRAQDRDQHRDEGLIEFQVGNKVCRRAPSISQSSMLNSNRNQQASRVPARFSR
jgi:hypothetical protein